MARAPSSFTEADVRVRPGRRGSRPRSKQRPHHSRAEPGMVTAVDRGRYRVLTDAGRPLVAVKARELGRGSIVVGDRVDTVGDLSGDEDTLARVVRVQPRSTVLRRSADDADSHQRIIVANADQLVIVTALADPQPRRRMIDRCLVAAFDAGMDALLCVTKADLAPAEPFLAGYADLRIPTVATRRNHVDATSIEGLEDLTAQLTGRISVLVGHSGVGKSTLVNSLVPAAERATGGVNEVTGRGRHTSSSAVALALSDGGWIVDTPGVRSFGLAHVDRQRFLSAFGDLARAAEACPRGCTHAADAPDCALDEWAASAGPIATERLESFRRLLASRLGTEE